MGVHCNQKFQFKVDTLENGVAILKDGEYVMLTSVVDRCRNTISGEQAICDYFISKCADKTLLGGDDAATVQEWREVAASVTK